MDSKSIKSLLDTIVEDVNAGADFLTGVDPALAPLVAIGKAIDKQIPGLVANVADWISGAQPTPEDLQKHADTLAALSDPNAP